MTAPRQLDDIAEVVARLYREWVAGRGGVDELTDAEVDQVARALLPAHRRLLAAEAAEAARSKGGKA